VSRCRCGADLAVGCLFRVGDVDAPMAECLDGNVAPGLPLVDPTVTFTEFVANRDENTAEPLIAADEGTLLPAGGLAILAAKVHDGKTTFGVVELVLHACAGVVFVELEFPRPLRVLVIENEGPREAFRQKLEARLATWEHDGTPRIWDSATEWGQVRISDPATRERLRAVVVEHRIDLVVSDSLTRFGMRGNGTPEETREFVDWLTELGLGRDLAFLLLHHPRTRAEQNETDLERIAGAWPPHADLILLLQKLGGDRARLAFTKTRWLRGDRPTSILAFDPRTETFAYVADEHGEERDYVGELAELMADGEWRTVNALRKPKPEGGIGAAPDSIKEALTDDRFESVKGDKIGERSDATYYRLRQASQGPDDAHDAMPFLLPEEGQASPSPPKERAIGGDACSGRDAPADVAEVERLADLSVEAQRDSTREPPAA
jgi:hypothetical protein